MKKRIKKGVVVIFALLFLVLGAIGFMLPFLPGFIFIAVALILLSLISLTMRNYIEKHTSKYPVFHRLISKMDGFIRRVVGEI